MEVSQAKYTLSMESKKWPLLEYSIIYSILYYWIIMIDDLTCQQHVNVVAG